MAEGLAGSPDEPPAITELVGTELGGRYQLERVLGAGAMGTVFEAKDRRLARPVAVKVMQPGYARDAEYVKRFLREAQAASKIRHRNVVTMLDYGQLDGGLVYSVMELLVGEDLEEFLRKQPGQRVGWAQACELLVQLANGLRAAHRQGVIHRDIKPANCVLTTEDDELVVKVVDFGIAKLSEGAQTQQLTGTGNVLGTPSYTAPERVLTSAPATPRSDVYSLGVVAYRMLTGRLPFTGKTSFEVMHHACLEPVPPMREPGMDLPAAMETLVLEMLAKTPEQRPADMGEVRQRLQALGREAGGVQDEAQQDEARQGEAQPSEAQPSEAQPGGVQDEVETVRRASLRVEALRIEAGEEKESPTEVLDREEPKPAVEATVVSTAKVPGQVSRTEVPRWRKTEPVKQSVVVATAVLPEVERTKLLAAASSGPTPREATPEPVAERAGPVPGVNEPWSERSAAVGIEDDIDDPRPHATSTRWYVAVGTLVVIVLVGVALSMNGGGEEQPEARAVASPASVAFESARVGDEPPPLPAEIVTSPLAEAEAPSAPLAGSAGSPVEERPATKAEARKTRKPKKPVGAPSDSELEKTLAQRIRAECAVEMAGKSVIVAFDVTPSGGIVHLAAMPKGAAGECAKRQVVGTRFRPRASETNMRIVVNRTP